MKYQKENPKTRPTPNQPAEQPDMDSRDGHGLAKDEALKGKK